MTVRREMRVGKARLVIDISFRDRDGKRQRYRKDAQVQTLTAARAEERRLLAHVAEHGTLPSSAVETVVTTKAYTFSDAVAHFHRTKALSTLKPSTRVGYDSLLDQTLVPLLGVKGLADIDGKLVTAMDAQFVSDGLKASTRRNIQCALRSVLRSAVDGGLLPAMPQLPKLPKVGGTVARSLSANDVAVILGSAAATAELPVALAFYAGLRAGEVRGLRWSDVDFKAGTLVVRRAICRGHEAPPKSGHHRVVPLAAPLKTLLETAAKKPHNPWAPVTTSSRGEVWSEWGIRKAFQAACKKAKVGKWRFHDLRHAFVSELFRAGVSAPVVQKLAGHKELATTARYAHVADEQLRAAVATFGRGNGVETTGA